MFTVRHIILTRFNPVLLSACPLQATRIIKLRNCPHICSCGQKKVPHALRQLVRYMANNNSSLSHDVDSVLVVFAPFFKVYCQVFSQMWPPNRFIDVVSTHNTCQQEYIFVPGNHRICDANRGGGWSV